MVSRARMLITGLAVCLAGASNAQPPSSDADVDSLAARARANAAAYEQEVAPSQGFTIEELADFVRHSEENSAELLGEELADLPSIVDTARETYAQDMESVRERTLEIFEQGLDLARDLAGSQIEALERSGQIPGESPEDARWKKPRFRLFISQSMPDAEVKALVDLAKEDPSLVLVLRGLKPDQNITEVYTWIGRMLKPLRVDAPMPAITIDPAPFAVLGVDQAPVLAEYDEEGKLLSFALGMTSRHWLAEQTEKGRRGNLGAYGPTVPVAEVDLIEVIKAKAEAYDWAASAEGALDRFWARTPAHDLPRSPRERVRMLDPTFEVTQSIEAPDGTVIAAVGDRVNPLDAIPVMSTLLFFNPADADQVAWAKKAVAKYRNGPLTVMASQLRSLDGLDGLGTLSTQIGARVFSLPEDVRRTFHIERVPTVVTAQGNVFHIHEQVP